jgi:hypothetical protein
MNESDKIRVENLKETLRQFQSNLVWGIGSSLSYLILSVSDLGSTHLSVPLPGAFVSVTTDFARAIALAIAWGAGALASYAHERARRIAYGLRSEPDLLRATLTFPSIATEIYPLVRVLPAILPAVFLFIGLLAEWMNTEGETASRLLVAVLLLAPYLTLIIDLTYLSLPLDKPPRLRLDR